jgi:uncharacterized iron-regulated membrane protein
MHYPQRLRTIVRKLLFTIHLYLALIAGVFIVILGVTGSIMAFEPELDHWLHSNLWHVKPEGRALSLAEIGVAVNKRFPGEPITAYTLPNSADLAYQVALKRGIVFVNPYTADIIGVRPPGPDFLSRVHQLHLRLTWTRPLPSDAGKTIMSVAGVVILFLSISGLYLWWPLKRFTIKAGASGWRFWFDAHSAIGIFSLLFLLMLSFTGVLIGFDDAAVPLMYKVTGSQPAEAPKVPPPAPGAVPIGVDRAMERFPERLRLPSTCRMRRAAIWCGRTIPKTSRLAAAAGLLSTSTPEMCCLPRAHAPHLQVLGW